MKKISVIIFFLVLINQAFACNVGAPSLVNLAISTAEEKIFAYGVKTVDEKLPAAYVSNCRETANKRRFVMVTFGPEIVAQNDSIRGTNFDKQYAENNNCSLRNNPLSKILSAQDVKKDFDTRWKFINECVEVHVTERGSRPLTYPLDQNGCKIEKINEKSAKFSGGFCFFKPSQDSELVVSLGVKDTCKTLNGFKNIGVDLLDLESGVAFYTSSTYKDEITDLSAFGSYPVRLSINPVNQLFRSSDDYGILRPTFPEDYPVNDLHMGKIEILDQDEKSVSLKTPFIVNNSCKAVEKNGLRSSICNYAVPVVGEIQLKDRKGQEIKTWFDGGIAPIQWQGILNGEGIQLSKELLRKNENYTLEVNFSDPYFDYNTFKKRIKSKFQSFNYGFPEFSSGGEISEIGDIQDIGDVNQMVDVGGIGNLDFKSGLPNLDNSRKRLGAYFSTNLYPPMYTKACHVETGLCAKTGKSFVKFIVTFKVNGDYSLTNIEVERSSQLLGSYKKKIELQPEFVCQ